MPDDRLARRVATVKASGAESADLIDAVLRYTAPLPPVTVSDLPMPDAPHVAAWREYADEARRAGAVATLRSRFPQFHFPISEGISQTPAYQAATRRGEFDAAEAAGFNGFEISTPSSIDLAIVQSPAGHVPVVTIGDRRDFESFIQAFTERNEPVRVPPSLGACLVRGLINWNRVEAYRSAWRREHPDGTPEDWKLAFSALAADKPKYQDTIVLLSRGPYSGLPADQIGLDPATWLDRSVVIRRDHELTHYLTARIHGAIRSHFLDEVLADFAGLRGAFGRYDAGLALRLLGLETTPPVPGGRFEVYQSEVPAGAAPVIAALVRRAAEGLALVDRRWPIATGPAATGRLMLALFALTLDELASPDMLPLVAEALG